VVLATYLTLYCPPFNAQSESEGEGELESVAATEEAGDESEGPLEGEEEEEVYSYEVRSWLLW